MPLNIFDPEKHHIALGECISHLEVMAEIDKELRGLWRLGEVAPPFAETSGHPYGPADGFFEGSGTAIETDVAGALRAPQDDGAVDFKSVSGSVRIVTSDPSPRRFNFGNADGPNFTVCAWLKPRASSGIGTAVGAWLNSPTFGPGGWRLGFDYTTRKPFFQRGNTVPIRAVVYGNALTIGPWYFLAGSYDEAEGHKIYVNGVLHATNPTLMGSLPSWNTGPYFGLGHESGSSASFLLGGLDEVSIWGGALTAGEILDLYEGGLC